MNSTPYQTRLDRVRQLIALDPDGDLSLDRMAETAAFSRFHFHRVFAAMTGETLAQAVRRARLNRAAVLVVTSPMPMAQVARSCGYPEVRSFARVFKSAFGTTPTALRKGGLLPPALLPTRKGELPMHDVRIETLPPRRLAALIHLGAYPRIGQTFERLWQTAVTTGLVARVSGPAVAVYRDAPDAVPVDQLRAIAGLEIAGDAAMLAGLEEVTLTGGRHAVLTLRGPYAGLPAAWAWLYGDWLPGSGEEPADSPPFEVYPNGPQDTAPADLVTEICVPLRD